MTSEGPFQTKAFYDSMILSAISTCFLKTSRIGDSTTALGSLFQCLTTLSVKKFFLISNLKLSDAT